MTTSQMWISHHQALSPMLTRLQRRLRMLMSHLQAEKLCMKAEGMLCALMSSHDM